MYCQVFDLERYFKQTQIYFYLFDGLFLLENDKKQQIFNKLSIIPSSYRTQRSKVNTTRESINKLLSYFNYVDVNKDEQLEFEVILSKIYYCCYYKQLSKLYYYLEIINDKINQNSILKPLLVLFRVLINMNLEYEIPHLKEIVWDDLQYLKVFYNKHYFAYDLKYLYLIILYDFEIIGENIEKKLDNMSIDYPKLTWLYYHIKASKAYFDHKDAIALINYEFLLEEFRRTNNLERYFLMVNNVAALYNVLGEYHLSYNVTSTVIEYIFSSENHHNRIEYILMNFLFANLMLGRYQEIINFVDIIIFDYNCLNAMSASICLIAADNVGELEHFDNLLSKDYDDINYNIIVSYLKTKDKKILEGLIMFPYSKKIKEVLLSC